MVKYEQGQSMVSEAMTRGGLQSAIENMRAASFLKRTWLLFASMQPLVMLFEFSMTQSAKKRAILLAVKVLGALMMIALFFSAATNTTSWQSPEDCAVSGTKEEIIRNVTIGIISLFLATGPAILVGRLEKRKFIYRPEWTEQQKRRQLFRWRLEAGCVWCFGLVYVGVCSLFVVAFIANVSKQDHLGWLQAAASELLSLLLLEPFLLAILHAVFVSIVLRRGGGRLLDLAKQRLGLRHDNTDVETSTPVEKFSLDHEDTQMKAEMKAKLGLASDSAFWEWAWRWAQHGEVALLDQPRDGPEEIPGVLEARPPTVELRVTPPAPPLLRSASQALRLVDPGPRLPHGPRLASWSPSMTPTSTGQRLTGGVALQDSALMDGAGAVAVHESSELEHEGSIALHCPTRWDHMSLPQHSSPVWALPLPPANALTPLPRFDQDTSLPGSLPSDR